MQSMAVFLDAYLEAQIVSSVNANENAITSNQEHDKFDSNCYKPPISS